MSLTSTQSGSQTAVIDAEHFLGGAITVSGAYVLVVDLSNLAMNDLVSLRVYTRLSAAGTLQKALEYVFQHAQIEKTFYTVVLPSDAAYLAAIQQTEGTGRVFEWNILRLSNITQAASGTQTTVISTEHTLATTTTPGVYILAVDLSPLVTGDRVELRIKTKTKSGGTSRLAYEFIAVDGVAMPNTYSIPVPVDTEISCTLKQTTGSSRAFEWNLFSL